MEFRNPYHFVPVVSSKSDQPVSSNWDTTESLPAGQCVGVNHGIYDRNLLSGVIHCSIRTVTPTVVGGARVETHKDLSQPNQVDQFMMGDQPAFPATSLKGLIGSMLESVSQSSLRVLESEKLLTVRNAISNNKQDVTMGVIVSSDGKLIVRSAVFDGDARKYMAGAIKVPRIRLRERLNALGIEETTKSMHKGPLAQTEVAVKFDVAHPTQADLATLVQVVSVDHRNELLRNGYLVGYPRFMNFPAALHTELESASDETKKRKERIVITHLPSGIGHIKEFPLTDAVIDRWKKNAEVQIEINTSTETPNPELPYMPTYRDGNRVLDLLEGDLVFVKLKKGGQSREVQEVSFSSVWRTCIEDSTEPRSNVFNPMNVGSFFNKIDPELQPFNPARAKISPAEKLLGFVTQVDNQEKHSESVTKLKSWKGRLRFSHALPTEPLTDVENYYHCAVHKPLKILATPKLPSPNMYFNKVDGGFFAKGQLNGKSFLPKGRKMYLHNQDAKSSFFSRYPEKDAQMKSKVRPLKAGLEFSFEIRFDNLSESELDMLCYCLQPNDEFEHKLGMGKPLGLGSVKIQVRKVLFQNLTEKYSVNCDLFGPNEFSYLIMDSISVNDRSKRFRESANQEVIVPIEAIGNPKSTTGMSVNYPVANRQMDDETETYTWFVNNELHNSPENLGVIGVDARVPIMRANSRKKN